MTNHIFLRRASFLLVVMCIYGSSDAVNCVQCNMRHRGIANTCLVPRNMTNCMGCMKTVTKVKLRDSGYMTGWERTSVVVSRYCMRRGSTNIKPAGCYFQQNNGGYTERCFCYTDNCNSGSSSVTFNMIPSLLSPSLSSFWIFANIAIVILLVNNVIGCEPWGNFM